MEMNAISVDSAKERFLAYKDAGVIKEHCTFEDDIWRTTNEYANVGLYFDFNRFAYRKYEPVFGISFRQFKEYAKAFAVSIFSKNVLDSIEYTLLDIKHLLEIDYHDVCWENPDLKIYSANRMEDFISLLITDENEDKLSRLVASLHTHESVSSSNDETQRELAAFDSYLDFGEIMEDFWNSSLSK